MRICIRIKPCIIKRQKLKQYFYSLDIGGIKPVSYTHLLQDQNPISADLISKGFFTILLDMALQSDEIDYFVLDKVTYYANSLINYSRLINDIDNLDLAQAIIFYLDRLNYKDEANRLLNLFIITIEKSRCV